MEKILSLISEEGDTQPYSARVFEFGAIVAVYDIALRLNVVEIIDSFVDKREQGLSVGEYILIAAINRCVSPVSKSRVADWYQQTVLQRLMPVDKRLLASQRFWDHMKRLDSKKIEEIEDALSERLISEFNLNLQELVYDTTNFFTYIDTMTESEIPQRGKSKEKRTDLRIIGLALLVTMDFHIPLCHHVYQGNRHDSKEFISITNRLVERYKQFSESCESITVVYDKGNNSKAGQELIQKSPYHYVGSLKPSDHKELLLIPRSEYVALEGAHAGEYAYRTTKTVFGKEQRLVVTYNESLYLGQLQGFTTQLRKVTSLLKEMCKKLEDRRSGKVTKGKTPTCESVENKVKSLLKGPFLKNVVRYTVIKEDSIPTLQFSIDQSALNDLSVKHFGKTVLFSDQMDWTNEQIIEAYRGQHHIEDAFKVMKNPQFVAWKPMHHRTDHNIHVHAFYCVISLTLVSLLRRELHIKGVKLSIQNILLTLESIEEVVHIYKPESKRKNHLTLTEMNEKQQLLFETLELHRYAP